MARNKIKIKIEDNATKTLEAVRLTLRSPEITQEVQRGAELMAAAARQRAPVRTGALRKGIYTASSLKNNRPSATRQVGSKDQELIPDLKYPPRKGQVLVVSGTFYGRWVEAGHKTRKPAEGTTKGRGKGRTRRRPFFKPGIRAARSSAESFIRRRIERLIQERANK